MNIAAETVPIVRAAIADLIAGFPGLVGISCLARGADSVFAEVVLEAGAQFDALIARAATIRAMDFDSAGREAYEAANEVLVGDADRMIAAWDGKVGERAGTGTVVALARERGIPVDVCGRTVRCGASVDAAAVSRSWHGVMRWW